MSRFKSRRVEIVAGAGLIVGLWFVLLFSYAGARNIKRGAACQTNLKQVALATMQYVRDYDEKFPVADRWSKDLLNYCKTDEIFHCPSVATFGYAMNTYLDKVSIAQITEPSKQPLVFDSSSLKQFQHDAGTTWLGEVRHPQGNAVVFSDGHAAMQSEKPAFHYIPPIPPEPLLSVDVSIEGVITIPPIPQAKQPRQLR